MEGTDDSTIGLVIQFHSRRKAIAYSERLQMRCAQCLKENILPLIAHPLLSTFSLEQLTTNQ